MFFVSDFIGFHMISGDFEMISSNKVNLSLLVMNDDFHYSEYLLIRRQLWIIRHRRKFSKKNSASSTKKRKIR